MSSRGRVRGGLREEVREKQLRGWLCSQPSTGREEDRDTRVDRHMAADDTEERIQAEDRIQTHAEAARCTEPSFNRRELSRH